MTPRETRAEGALEAPTRIVDGIEWYTWTREDGTEEEDCQCARCGSSIGTETCEFCGGAGGTDDSEDCDWCLGDGCDSCCEDCHWCDSEGGWRFCLSSREWCEANPMPGREHIESTARTRTTQEERP